MQGYFLHLIREFKHFLAMHTTFPKLSCPPEVRGMKILDRTAFSRDIEILVLKVDNKLLSSVQKLIKKYFIKLDNFKPVQGEEGTSKVIFLDPDKIASAGDLEITDLNSLKDLNIDETNFSTKVVTFKYENWKCEQIFKAVLPENAEIVSGYTQIGHVLHLNLRDHLLEYKKLIGNVLLDKVKSCRTVVNKANVIDNTYRNFAMELLAGDEDFFVTVKENNCKFEFDFSKVYWNSRLHKEHERIIQLLQTGDVLFDVFAGVGPFSIPAAKKKCNVFANDLNPESFKWLMHNSQVNKIKNEYLKSYNLDGAAFIRTIMKTEIENLITEKWELSPSNKIHITMNLPAMAVQFLQFFNGLLPTSDVKLKNEILVHVYCFVHGEDKHESVALQLVNENINWDITKSLVGVFHVRNVAPAKEMMRVTFRLENEVLANATTTKRELDCEDMESKKLCLNKSCDE